MVLRKQYVLFNTLQLWIELTFRKSTSTMKIHMWEHLDSFLFIIKFMYVNLSNSKLLWGSVCHYMFSLQIHTSLNVILIYMYMYVCVYHVMLLLNVTMGLLRLKKAFGPLYWHGLTLILAWISNHMPSNMWDEIVYLFLNFNSYTVEV